MNDDNDFELDVEMPLVFGREDLTGFYAILDEDGVELVEAEVDDD